MSRIPRYSRAVALALLLSSLPLSGAFAHCFVGARFFPATLAIDDPCVADETVAADRRLVPDRRPNPRPANGTSRQRSRNASPRISAFRSATPGPKSVSPAALPRQGSATWKPRFSISCSRTRTHELAMLLGLIVDWGGTGATHSGLGTPYSCSPRPIISARVSATLPTAPAGAAVRASPGRSAIRFRRTSYDLTQNAFIPQVLIYGASLQYSMPYLKSRDQRPSAPRFHQSSDPDRRSAALRRRSPTISATATPPPARSIRA